VALLARYPVKSLCGEELDEVEVGESGLAGDRRWAVYTEDGGIGSGKTTRRFRRVDGLLFLRATLDGTCPVVEFPGNRLPADDPAASELLSTMVGQAVTLRSEGDVPHHDESPVHLISTAAVRRVNALLGGPVDVARFRANVVLETAGVGYPEDDWTGRELRLGPDVVLRLGEGMPRCVMVDQPQRGLERDGRILRTLAEVHELTFGLQAHVVTGGLLRRGHAAVLL
jgi:uncharacterized protein YcbX